MIPDYIPCGYSYSAKQEGIIQEYFNTAAAICSGEVTNTPEMACNVIQRVDNFASLLKKMDVKGKRPAAIALCNRIVQELARQYPGGLSKIAKWIALNTDPYGNGAYLPFHNFFQTIAELKGKPRLLSPVFDKSEEALELLNLRLIDSQAYKPPALLHMDDFMKLVVSEDLKRGGNLFRTCKKYFKASQNERMVDVTALGIQSWEELITHLGQEGCAKVRRLDSVPVDFVFRQFEDDNLQNGNLFSVWQTREEMIKKIPLHFPNLAYITFRASKENDAFYKADTLYIKNFPWDTNFSFLQGLPKLRYLYMTDCKKVNDYMSLAHLNIKVLKILGAGRPIKFDFLLSLPRLHSIWVSASTVIPDVILNLLGEKTIVAYSMGTFSQYSINARNGPQLLLT